MHKIRINILILALVAALLIVGLAFTLGEAFATELMTLAGAYVGALAAVMREMVAPDPDPAVPASVVSQIIKAYSD